MRRFLAGFGLSSDSLALVSSFSDSLAAPISRLPSIVLLNELVLLCEMPGMGVRGGVVRGRTWGCDELVAVTSGTVPSVGVGLLMTVFGCVEIVWMEEAEDDRAGLPARPVGAVLAGAGVGFAREGDAA
jgi:hypothetical protein